MGVKLLSGSERRENRRALPGKRSTRVLGRGQYWLASQRACQLKELHCEWLEGGGLDGEIGTATERSDVEGRGYM